jgi:hypothetical protein
VNSFGEDLVFVIFLVMDLKQRKEKTRKLQKIDSPLYIGMLECLMPNAKKIVVGLREESR